MKRTLTVRKREMTAPLFIRANVVPASVNEADRTVDVTFATETPVMRNTWNGKYNEVLSMKPSAIRMDRLNAGEPFLDNHNSYGSVRTVMLGSVVNGTARVSGKKGIATVKISRSEDKVWDDIKDGITTNISVGYYVHAYEVSDTPENETPTYTATDWEPYEISLTPIPADYHSTVRNNDGQTHIVKIKKMKRNINRSPEPGEGGGGNNPNLEANPTPAVRTAAELETERLATEHRTAGVEAERQRSILITKSVRQANLPTDFAETLIIQGKTIDEARAAILDKLAEGNGPGSLNSDPSFRIGTEDRDKKRKAMEETILIRAGVPGLVTDRAKYKPEEDMAREYRGLSLFDMGRECLEAAGVKTREMSRREIAQMALGLDSMGQRSSTGSMGTSDFPNILANTINRSLRMMYELAPRTFKDFCRQTTINDFRPVYRDQLSNLADALTLVPENGEYQATSMKDTAETYALAKYGKKIVLTWEALVNDDLNAFARIPMAISNAAAQTQSNLVWNIMLNNPNLSDGHALFSTAHGNIDPSPGVISLASLGEARLLMRKQVDLEGNFLNLQPEFIMVGAAMEQLAYQFMSTNYVATKSGDINIYQGSTKVIVEPRITGNKWFMSCSPSRIDTIEYAFLEGEGELFTEQRIGFDVDGIEIKARMVFGAAAIDGRGVYYNAGA